MPGRSFNADKYKFGFQGEEKDDEIHGSVGSAISFKYRIHDPRIGRFLSIDPLSAKYPFYSPYAFSGNRVIDRVELEGLEPSKGDFLIGETQLKVANQNFVNFKKSLEEYQKYLNTPYYERPDYNSDGFYGKAINYPDQLDYRTRPTTAIGMYIGSMAEDFFLGWMQSGWGTYFAIKDPNASKSEVGAYAANTIVGLVTSGPGGIRNPLKGKAGQTIKTKSGYNVKIKANDCPEFTPWAEKTAILDDIAGDATDAAKANYQVFREYFEEYNIDPNSIKARWVHKWAEGGKYKDYTWHHVEDVKTMQLVPSDLNNFNLGGLNHAGGSANKRAGTGDLQINE